MGGGIIFVDIWWHFKNSHPTSTFEKLTITFISCSTYEKMKS